MRRLIILMLLVSLASCGGAADPTTTAGSSTTAASGLPAGLPSEIPLVDGDVVRSTGDQARGIWIVIVRAEGSPEDARSQAEQALEEGGFEPDPSTGIFAMDNFKVVLQVAPEGGGTSLVNYSITQSFTR